MRRLRRIGRCPRRAHRAKKSLDLLHADLAAEGRIGRERHDPANRAARRRLDRVRGKGGVVVSADPHRRGARPLTQRRTGDHAMTSVTTKPDSSQPAAETAVYLFDDWFDPIEAGVRDRVAGTYQMSVYKLVVGLVGLLLASAVVVSAVVGVATTAPVAAQDNHSDASPSSWGCAPEPWPYGCQWRAQPVTRIMICGLRPA